MSITFPAPVHLAKYNRIEGTTGDDRLNGSEGRDSVTGGDGADTIHGRGGHDEIDGQAGDDLIFGGAGDDRIQGVAGLDTLFGGRGDDRLLTLFQHAELHGGAGDDYLTADGGSTLDGGAGFDEVVLTLWDDTDHDLDLSGLAHGQSVQIDAETVLYRVEAGTIYLKGGDDRVISGALNFNLTAGDGDDTLVGGDSNNFLRGEGGDDLLVGGAGVIGDYLDGGRGFDTVSYADADGAVQVSFKGYGGRVSGAAGGDSLHHIEHAIGSAFDDTLVGKAAREAFEGGAGDDRIDGGQGADTITGGAGADTFLFGRVTDSFHYGPDLITDLEAQDVIDLHRVDADSTVSGDQAFVIVAAFSGHAGQLTVGVDAETGQTVFSGDVDGDGGADVVILATGDHSGFSNLVL